MVLICYSNMFNSFHSAGTWEWDPSFIVGHILVNICCEYFQLVCKLSKSVGKTFVMTCNQHAVWFYSSQLRWLFIQFCSILRHKVWNFLTSVRVAVKWMTYIPQVHPIYDYIDFVCDVFLAHAFCFWLVWTLWKIFLVVT